jgi:hypothetical protein
MENFLSLTTAVPAFLHSLVEAGDGTRTRDPQLGRLMLYQLSYTRVSHRARPTDCLRPAVSGGGRIRTYVGR